MRVSLADHKFANPGPEDYVDFGLRNGVTASRMLALYREQGGAIRTADFMALWRNRRAGFARAAAS